ncbi:DUF397 domain-containing protein [Streptomyces sp. CAU 1734]|uniref:DUF397 domain-containing protein n=1 Tax=Streptomyces sp. CAU 1734 TaxID=3140360 RepID=UPI0032604BFF
MGVDSSPAATSAVWVKSTYSGNGGSSCLEWAPAHAQAHHVVPVRDSKQPEAPALMLSPGSWAGLVAYARGTEL